MSYAVQSARYLEADIASRPKEWLVPLLYEHLLASLRRASVQIEARDIEGKAASLQKACTILIELRSSLDLAQGGEIASGLAALYSFFMGEILTVGRTLDALKLRRLIDMTSDLHEAWVQAAEIVAPRIRTDAVAAGA